MPLIQVRVIKDVFSKEQKRQIISKLTDAMVSIEGESMRGVTWCVVEEVESGDWGIGGNALTTADVQALARGKRLPERRDRTPNAARPDRRRWFGRSLSAFCHRSSKMLSERTRRSNRLFTSPLGPNQLLGLPEECPLVGVKLP